MKFARSFGALFLFGSSITFAASSTAPTISYANSAVPRIGAAATKALEDAMTTAGVTACTISRTTATSSDQARVMYEFVEGKTVDAARKLYGPEGDQVIEVYVAARAEKLDRAQIIAGMEKKLVEVLPAARANNRLMHLDRKDFDVFDVGMTSIKPADKGPALVAAAKAGGKFVRVLDPSDGEKDAYHFEFKK